MKKMILYNYFRSSASYRVRIALNLKNIPWEYKIVHLLKDGGQQKSESYRKLNPLMHVPTLVDGDFVLSESMAILDYLDHVVPEPALFPKEAKARAQVIRFCEVINSGIQPLQNLKVNQYLQQRIPSEPGLKDEWNIHWISKGLEVVEQLLAMHGGTYCFGNQVTAADCLLIPQLVSSKRFGVDLAPYKLANKIAENCEKLKAFSDAHPSRQPDSE